MFLQLFSAFKTGTVTGDKPGPRHPPAGGTLTYFIEVPLWTIVLA